MKRGYGRTILLLMAAALTLTACTVDVEIETIDVTVATLKQTQAETAVETSAEREETVLETEPVESTTAPIQTTAQVQTVDGATLQKLADERTINSAYLIVDVRTAPEFETGHLKGAVNFPHTDLINSPSLIAGWEQLPVYLYCVSGNRSSQAAQALIEAGFTQVFEGPGVNYYRYHFPGS